VNVTARSAVGDDPLAGWDTRRRAALEVVWDQFQRAAGDMSLSDELIDERRRQAHADDASVSD